MSLFRSIYQNMIRKFLKKEYWRRIRQERAEKRAKKGGK